MKKVKNAVLSFGAVWPQFINSIFKTVGSWPPQLKATFFKFGYRCQAVNKGLLIRSFQSAKPRLQRHASIFISEYLERCLRHVRSTIAFLLYYAWLVKESIQRMNKWPQFKRTEFGVPVELSGVSEADRVSLTPDTGRNDRKSLAFAGIARRCRNRI